MDRKKKKRKGLIFMVTIEVVLWVLLMLLL